MTSLTLGLVIADINSFIRSIYEALILSIMEDPFAEQILYHWIFGNGQDLIINNDVNWNLYFWNNNAFQDRIYECVRATIESGANCFADKHPLTIAIHKNGGYTIGYDLLNGSEKTVGGYYCIGKISYLNEKFMVKITYSFNDRIDVNDRYRSDVLAYYIAKGFVLNLGHGNDYTISINGTIYFVYKAQLF